MLSFSGRLILVDKKEIYGNTFDSLQKQVKENEVLICDAQSADGSMFVERKIQNDENLIDILQRAHRWGLNKIKFFAVKKDSWS